MIAIDARSSRLSQANFGYTKGGEIMNLTGAALYGNTVLQISFALPASVPGPGGLGLEAVALAALGWTRRRGRHSTCR